MPAIYFGENDEPHINLWLMGAWAVGITVAVIGVWLYSDYPLTINEQPIIGYDAKNAKPSNSAPALESGGQ